MYATALPKSEAVAFMDEHGITLDTLGTRCDDAARRAYWDVTVKNKRGQVTFTDYSPSPSHSIYDHDLVLADLISFVSFFADDEDAEPIWAHQAEVLEAMTGCAIEYLASVFADYEELL